MSTVFPNPKIRYSLWALMVLGLLIRLSAAFIQPNYIDEGFNYYICQQGWISIYDHLKIDVHTPFIHLLNYPITQCTSNIFWMRLLGVICGTLNIGVAFVLFRRFLQPKISLFLAAFLACDFSLWQSDALFRPYATLALSITMVGLGMVDILRTGLPFRASPEDRCPRWPWALFFLACLGCACSHMLGILALVPCFIWACFTATSTRTRALACIVSGTIPSIVWFIIGPLRHLSPNGSASNVTNVTWEPFFSVPSHIFNFTILPSLYQGPHDDLAVFLRYASNSVSPWINIILFAIFAWCVAVTWRQFPRVGAFLSMLVLLPPLFVALAIALGKMEIFQAHYVVPFTAMLLLLPACALKEHLFKNLLALLLGISLLITVLFPTNRLLWIQDWQSAIDFIDARQKAGDHIGVNISYAFYSFALAYDGDNIHFTYNNATETIEHNPGPGKLVALPLRLDECNEALLNYLGAGKLFLVLCESDLENRQVPLWLDQYYEVEDSLSVPSENYWARVIVLQLKRRSSTQVHPLPDHHPLQSTAPNSGDSAL